MTKLEGTYRDKLRKVYGSEVPPIAACGNDKWCGFRSCESCTQALYIGEKEDRIWCHEYGNDRCEIWCGETCDDNCERVPSTEVRANYPRISCSNSLFKRLLATYKKNNKGNSHGKRKHFGTSQINAIFQED